MKAKFVNEKFKTKEDFEKWLAALWKYKVTLDPMAGDMQTMWIHESGEILHCDFHARLYNGSFADVEQISEGNYMTITRNEETKTYWGLLIEEVKINSRTKAPKKKRTKATNAH